MKIKGSLVKMIPGHKMLGIVFSDNKLYDFKKDNIQFMNKLGYHTIARCDEKIIKNFLEDLKTFSISLVNEISAMYDESWYTSIVYFIIYERNKNETRFRKIIRNYNQKIILQMLR